MQMFIERLDPERVRVIIKTNAGVSAVDDMANDEAAEYGKLLIEMAGYSRLLAPTHRSQIGP